MRGLINFPRRSGVADAAFYLDQLLPVEALALLASASKSVGDVNAYTDFLLEPEQSVFGATATLILPEKGKEASNKERKARTDLLASLLAAYRDLKGSEPARAPLREEGFSMLEGLAWLCLHSGQDEAEIAEPCFPDEYLLPAEGLTDEQAAEIFEDLRFHATHTRLATATSGQTRCHIYHVMDDQERRSSFLSLEAGDGFRGIQPLVAYRSGEHQIFLPRSSKPSQRALDTFRQILQQVPILLGVSQINAQGLLLGIDAQSDSSGTIQAHQMYYLGQLSFVDQAHFVPRAKAETRFAFHPLEDSAQMQEQLRAALTKAAPAVGYRLELRPVQQKDVAEIERMRLLERQAEVAYKLAYLDSISRPRPQLLRFTERQLPALAEMIRAFPLEVLRKGFPKYAFQAREVPEGAPGSSDDQAGLHYLYIEPDDAVLKELDPLLHWGSGPGAPTRFHLDPFWARYYHGKDNRSLVFVPESLALFPSMHGWSSAHMDAYLRDVVGEWFADRDVPELPPRPAYVFEGSGSADAPITLSVLDLDGFMPLQTRLGWLNDHLHLGHALGMDHLIAQMAHDVSRKQLAEQIADTARKTEEELEGLLLTANRVTTRKLSELTDTVNSELNQVLNQTHDTANYLKELYDYLQELTRLGRGAENITAQAFRGLVKTEGKYRDLTRFIQKLENDIEHEIHQADMARHRVTQKIQRSITELGTTHEKLRKKLLEILRFRQ